MGGRGAWQADVQGQQTHRLWRAHDVSSGPPGPSRHCWGPVSVTQPSCLPPAHAALFLMSASEFGDSLADARSRTQPPGGLRGPSTVVWGGARSLPALQGCSGHSNAGDRSGSGGLSQALELQSCFGCGRRGGREGTVLSEEKDKVGAAQEAGQGATGHQRVGFVWCLQFPPPSSGGTCRLPSGGE